MIGWWPFLLLALAAFRVWKLAAEDAILDRPRNWLLARAPEWVLEWLGCPWCAGFWICLAALSVWCAVHGWIGWFDFAVCLFALSAAVGIVAHFLDD